MSESVPELAARCAVAVYGGGRFLGSGFLAAPGLVVTCAHVAAGGGAGPVTVRLAGQELATRQVRLLPPQAEPGRRTANEVAGELTGGRPVIRLRENTWSRFILFLDYDGRSARSYPAKR